MPVGTGQGRWQRGTQQPGCPHPRPARMQMNWEFEQNHYLGAQGFRSPCHWLQGAKPGPISPVRRGGGKYVGWGGGGGVASSPGSFPCRAEGKPPVPGLCLPAWILGSVTAPCQATGLAPPRHMDRSEQERAGGLDRLMDQPPPLT